MATSTNKNLRLGVFVSLGIMILIGFIYFIGANQSMFGSYRKVRTVFTNIGGLKAGARVRYAGITAGTVETITILNDTSVGVEMLVDAKVAPYIKHDSYATIGSDGIMGDKVINLTAGTPGSEPLPDNGMLRSKPPMEMDALMAQATEMATSFSTITNNLAEITGAIKNGNGTIGMLLYDDNMAASVRRSVGGINAVLASANKNMKNLETGTEALSENMKAAQSSILLRGYFRKRERDQQNHVRDSVRAIEQQQKKVEQEQSRQRKQEARDRRKDARKARRALRRGETPPAEPPTQDASPNQGNNQG